MSTRVLLVDPSPAIYRVAAWELCSEDLWVRGVPTAQDALDLLEQWMADLLVIAVTLPDVPPRRLAEVACRRWTVRTAFMGYAMPQEEYRTRPRIPWIQKDKVTGTRLRALAHDLRPCAYSGDD